MTKDLSGTDEAIAMHRRESDRLKEALGKEKDERKRTDLQALIDHHDAEVKNLRGSMA